MELHVYDIDQHVCDLRLEEFDFKLTRAQAESGPANVVVDGVERLMIEGRTFPKHQGLGVGSPLGSKAGGPWMPAEKRLAWMQERSISKGILLPGNLGLAMNAVEDIALKRALCASYHEWQLRDCDAYDGACKTALLADPYYLPGEEMMADARVAGLLIKPTNAQNMHLWEAPMQEIFRLSHECRKPIVVHGGTGYYQKSPVGDLYDSYFFTHLFSHHIETQMFLAELFVSNTLLKYPNATVVFVESGVSWLPSFVQRLLFHLRKLGHLVGHEPIDVLEAFKRNILFAAFMDDITQLEKVAAENGWLNLAIGTDFPHWDTFDIRNLEKLPVSREFLGRITTENAIRFFGE
jgi:hypothetical protein